MVATRRALAAIALALAAALPTVARADEDPAVEARRHFDAAERLFENADYDAAVAEYLAAWRAKPHPNVLYNIAVAYERVYRPDEARGYYERFLAESATGGVPNDPAQATLRARAEARLRVLRALPGALLVDASEPGASIRLDGGGVERAGVSPHRFEELPPGEYLLHVELSDYAPFDRKLRLEPGEHAVVHAPLEHRTELLTVTTRPPGARVFLDEHEEGRTPFARPVPTGRARRLRVEAEDFPPHEETVDVLPGHPIARDLVLRKPYRSGRVELVGWAMAHGAFGAIALAEALGIGKQPLEVHVPVIVLAGVGGVGVGFLASYLTTGDYVKVGHSSMVIGATLWGTVMGAGLGIGLGVPYQYSWALSLLGGGVGLSVGAIAARWSDPSAGDAAIVNSGGMWGATAGALLTEAIAPAADLHDRLLGFLSLGGCALGVATAALLAAHLEVDRAHVALVDVGGAAGLAIGFGLGFTIKDTATGARFGLGGAALGILAAAVLARSWHDEPPPTGALAMVDAHGVSLGLPKVSVGPAFVGPPGVAATGVRMDVTLASGTF